MAEPRLIERGLYPQVAALLALMAMGAATEGLGLMLLAPMLALLGPDSMTAASWLPALGIPVRLDLLLVLFVVLIGVRAVIVHWRSLAGLKLELAVAESLRQRAWRGLLHCDWRVLLRMKRSNSASLLITRVDQAGDFLGQAIAVGSTAVTLAGIACAALLMAPAFAIAAMVAGFFIVASFHSLRRKAGALGTALGQSYAEIHSSLNEGLGALRVIKALGAEDRAHVRLADQFAELKIGTEAYQKVKGRAQVLLQVLGSALLALLVWLALERWHLGIAVVLPMVALFARALPLIGILQQSLANCAHAWPAVEEALHLIAMTERSAEDYAATATPPDLRQEIRLEAATIQFAGEPRPALDGISLAIPARGILAVTGPSGSGKSTLADLIGGLLEPDGGCVTIDGIALTGPIRQAWRRRVAYVQQDPVLISATLRDNLRWAAPEASDAEMEQALNDASAQFALHLPQGLDTLLGDGGRQLSGGERQRLMLARALLRRPALLILDESTSALDAENETQIAKALQYLGKRMAIVVISHRGKLIDLAQRQIGLECGRLVRAG